MEPSKSFGAALFDFSFSEFITARLIRLLYALMLVVLGLFTIVLVVGAFAEGFGSGLVSLLLSPFFFLLGAVFVRIYLELVIVIFRIAEHLKQLVSLAERRSGQTPIVPPL